MGEQVVAESYLLEETVGREGVVGEREVVAWPLKPNEAMLFVVVSLGNFDLNCVDLVVERHFSLVEIGSERKVSLASDVEMVGNSETRVDFAVQRRFVVAAVFADCLSVAEVAGEGAGFAEVAEDVKEIDYGIKVAEDWIVVVTVEEWPGLGFVALWEDAVEEAGVCWAVESLIGALQD